MIAGPVFRAGGKSELRRAGWSLTATGGDPKESATENIPPAIWQVRVKRRGKSSPVSRVTGKAWQTPSGARPNRRTFEGGPPDVLGSCRLRQRATVVPDE